MILIGPDDFRFKNHDFSASGSNCFVYVIKTVQKLKISVFVKFKLAPWGLKIAPDQAESLHFQHGLPRHLKGISHETKGNSY